VLNYDIEETIQKQSVIITVTLQGYIKRGSLHNVKQQKRGGKGKSGITTRDQDSVIQTLSVNTHTSVLFFSTEGLVYKIKAWKRHKQMTLNLVVPIGKVRFILFDDRNHKSEFQEVVLSNNSYNRLTVPPLIWFGFQGLSKSTSLILNIADIVHDPDEIDRKALNEIDFDWSSC